MASNVFGVRLSVDDRARIDERRQQHPGLSRAEYMRLAALGELPSTVSIDSRFDAIEQRLTRVEQFQFVC